MIWSPKLLVRRFQFTHPGRGATGRIHYSDYTDKVSIHAPREGCDITIGGAPRLPKEFQFTHPGRGATLMLPDHTRGG